MLRSLKSDCLKLNPSSVSLVVTCGLRQIILLLYALISPSVK